MNTLFLKKPHYSTREAGSSLGDANICLPHYPVFMNTIATDTAIIPASTMKRPPKKIAT
jgi:hypothetical protein